MIHNALKCLRRYEAGVSQAELSRTLGISRSFISELESGKKSPTVSLLYDYSELFMMPLSSILLLSDYLEATPLSDISSGNRRVKKMVKHFIRDMA